MHSPYFESYISTDVLLYFFENYLDATSIIACKATCKRFYSIALRSAIPQNLRPEALKELSRFHPDSTIVKWFCLYLKCPLRELILPSAKSGNLDMITRGLLSLTDRHERGSFYRQVYRDAIKWGHPAIIEWISTEVPNPIVTLELWSYATASRKAIALDVRNKNLKYGHLNILQWCMDKIEFSDYDYTKAIKEGHTECVKWLCEVAKAPLTEYVLAAAAAKGDIPLMQWLYDRKCPVTMHAAVRAAKYNQLDALCWLRDHGCPLGASVTNFAAMAGHIDAVRWALENGCGRCAILNEIAHISISGIIQSM